jgi:NADH:ubiquinone oxidoreductase subunit 2 (subunit N)
VPDVYSTINYPVIFFFATLVKLIIYFFFLRFTFFIFFSYHGFLEFFFLIVGISSIIFGVLGSLFQNKLKLFLAFSSISHIGYLFIAISSFDFFGLFNSIFYFLFYFLATIFLYSLILNTYIIDINNFKKIKIYPILYISDLKGIYFKNKIVGFLFFFILFFFSGIPPFITFFAKF